MASLRQQIATTALTLTKFRDLMKRMQENRPQDDLTIVKKAYDYSLKHHEGQSRASGEPYLVHPLEVALVLAEMKMDPVAVAAGLLHDSVEDTSVTIVDIRKEFGEQVAHIVEGVTKISKIDFATREEQQAENLRKMMLAMVDDIRVVLIKLADRLHNMRTLEHLPPERQHKIAEETLEIYAPIAHRLGMGKIRGELEDLGFRFLDPARLRASRKIGQRPPQRGRGLSREDAADHQRQAERGRHSGARRKPHQAPLQHSQEVAAPAHLRRSGLRSVRHARDHAFAAGLLRRARHHSQPVASGARAHQGFHRHAAAQFLPVAAHFGDHGRRHAV